MEGEENDAKEEVVDYLDDCFIQEPAQSRKRTHGRMGTSTPTSLSSSASTAAGTKKRRMKEALEDGLARPLGRENKGFALLEKLGYQPETGKGIGKREDGIATPLPVVVKQDKLGIGEEERLKRAADARSERIRASQVSYRQQKSQEHELRRMRQSLQKAASVIQGMDEKEGIEKHGLWSIENADLLGREEVVSMLSDSLAYLRNTKLYCLWCSVRYESIHVSGPSD